MNKPTYTVAVINDDGTAAPDRTCGHAHKTTDAAVRCGTKLYAAKTINGNWQSPHWYVRLGGHCY